MQEEATPMVIPVVLGGSLSVNGFITGTGHPRIALTITEETGMASGPRETHVTLDGEGLHAMLGCLASAWADAHMLHVLHSMSFAQPIDMPRLTP